MLKKLKVIEKDGFTGFVLKSGVEPMEVIYSNLSENKIKFLNGEVENGVCINCDDKPCFRYSIEEINTEILEGFPYNNDRRVCPPDSILLNENSGIEINSDSCIGCGICIQRCPLGGINLMMDERVPKVNREPINNFEIIEDSIDSRRETSFQKFKTIKKTILIRKIKLGFSKNFRLNFFRVGNKINDLELILIRNLMISVGILNKVAAKGNVDTRIDFLGIYGSHKIPGESGLSGTDILGSPRRILEDFAILHSRYSIPKERIIPIIFLLEFPRKRSDYYEVISDIKNITGIEIKTLPVHFLLICNMLNVKFTLEDIKRLFFIDKYNQNFGDYAKNLINDIEILDENFGSELYTYFK